MFNRIVLKTIPKDDVSEKVVSKKTLYAIRGSGNVTLSCGDCMIPLVEGIVEGQLENRIIKCRKCKAYNKVRYPKLEILKTLLSGQNTIISGSATPAGTIALSLDMAFEDVRRELSGMIQQGLVDSEKSYFFLTRRGIKALKDLEWRMEK